MSSVQVEIDSNLLNKLDALSAESAGAVRPAMNNAAQSVAKKLIGELSLYPNKGPEGYDVPREALARQIARDEREEMIADVLDECVETALVTDAEVSAGKLEYREAQELTRAILLTAANLWGIGRDNSESEQQD